MAEFVKNMLKIELHAHLNGSLSNKTLIELHKLKYGDSIPGIDMDFFQIISSEHLSLDNCFKKFTYAHNLTNTKECLKLATECVIREFYEDNVCYLELRTTPKKTETLSKEDYLVTVLETIENCKTKYDIDVKLLPSIDRAQNVQTAKETIDLVIKLLEKYQDLIKGIDFSGDPSKNNFKMFVPVLERARKCNLKLALHCGEIENYQEVRDILEFGVDRIGHGTFIDNESMDIIINNEIPIECCLSSNIKCGTVQILADHHFKKLLELDHPVCVCTDDLGVFETTLTKELILCMETFNLSLDDLKELTMNTVNFCFLNEREKELLAEKIRRGNKLIQLTV